MSDLHQSMLAIGESALQASRNLALLSASCKNEILESIAKELEAQRNYIQEINAREVEQAQKDGLSEAMCDRLLLSDNVYRGMVKGLRDLMELDDPIGEELKRTLRPNGLLIRKVRVPIGVIGIIYESRPNVTVDAAGLCVKSSNAVILRGGKESLQSNSAIVEALVCGAAKAGLPDGAIQIVPVADREAVRELVQLQGKVDLIIPRGGEGLIQTVTEMARVPVLKHYKGVCHVYIDERADLKMALDIVENAKCQRPGVCNALETLLVHKAAAKTFLPELVGRLMKGGVVLRGDGASREISPAMEEATEDDWDSEYLALILAVKVVSDIGEAIDHINRHGSRHTDAIVSSDDVAQKRFAAEVDSSAVMINTSTRFNDGGEFGMGAEMGISTDKFHARGPVGLEELTTYKYIVEGAGQIRG